MLLSANFDIKPPHSNVMYNIDGPLRGGGGNSSPDDDDTGTVTGGYGGGWSSSGGGGGGGSDSDEGPTDEQKQAAKALEAVVAFNGQTLGDKLKHGYDALDTSDKNAKRNMDLQMSLNETKQGNEWFVQQKKLQNTLRQLRNKMGNAYYGSAAPNVMDDLAQADDISDIQILQALEEGNEDARQNYFEAVMNNINARNELAMNTEASARELFGDFASQINNINPKLASGEEGDNGQVIDSENRTLNVPDWFQSILDEASYEKNKKGVLDFKPLPLTRPQESLEAIQKKGSNGSGSTTGTANSSYSSLMATYERRPR